MIDAENVHAVDRAMEIRPLLEAFVAVRSWYVPHSSNEWKACIKITFLCTRDWRFQDTYQ